VQASFAVAHPDVRQNAARASGDPLLEPDRFFPAPIDHKRTFDSTPHDAQTAALTRLLTRCQSVRPYLDTLGELAALIERHEDPARVRRRISVALALEQPDGERVYGLLMPGELEAFRRLARRKLAAFVWVFS
jgi:hypothetical protein